MDPYAQMYSLTKSFVYLLFIFDRRELVKVRQHNIYEKNCQIYYVNNITQ